MLARDWLAFLDKAPLTVDETAQHSQIFTGPGSARRVKCKSSYCILPAFGTLLILFNGLLPGSDAHGRASSAQVCRVHALVDGRAFLIDMV